VTLVCCVGAGAGAGSAGGAVDAAAAVADAGEKKSRKMTAEAKAKRKTKRRERHLEKLRAAGVCGRGCPRRWAICMVMAARMSHRSSCAVAAWLSHLSVVYAGKFIGTPDPDRWMPRYLRHRRGPLSVTAITSLCLHHQGAQLFEYRCHVATAVAVAVGE
jgi:hypothetical protein